MTDEDGLEWLEAKVAEMRRDGEPYALCEHVEQTRNIIRRLAEWKASK